MPSLSLCPHCYPQICSSPLSFSVPYICVNGLPWWLNCKESICNAGNSGDLCLIPGLGKSPGEGNGHLSQYSCLENPMDRGAWWAAAHGVAKTQTWLSMHGIVYSSLLWSFMFLWCWLSLLFYFWLFIWDFSFSWWVWLKVDQFCLSFQRITRVCVCVCVCVCLLFLLGYILVPFFYWIWVLFVLLFLFLPCVRLDYYLSFLFISWNGPVSIYTSHLDLLLLCP